MLRFSVCFVVLVFLCTVSAHALPVFKRHIPDMGAEEVQQRLARAGASFAFERYYGFGHLLIDGPPHETIHAKLRMEAPPGCEALATLMAWVYDMPSDISTTAPYGPLYDLTLGNYLELGAASRITQEPTCRGLGSGDSISLPSKIGGDLSRVLGLFDAAANARIAGRDDATSAWNNALAAYKALQGEVRAQLRDDHPLPVVSAWAHAVASLALRKLESHLDTYETTVVARATLARNPWGLPPREEERLSVGGVLIESPAVTFMQSAPDLSAARRTVVGANGQEETQSVFNRETPSVGLSQGRLVAALPITRSAYCTQNARGSLRSHATLLPSGEEVFLETPIYAPRAPAAPIQQVVLTALVWEALDPDNPEALATISCGLSSIAVQQAVRSMQQSGQPLTPCPWPAALVTSQVDVCTFEGAGEPTMLDFDAGFQSAKAAAQCALFNRELRRAHEEMGAKTPWLFPEDDIKNLLANRESQHEYVDRDYFRLRSAFWVGKLRRMSKHIDIAPTQ